MGTTHSPNLGAIRRGLAAMWIGERWPDGPFTPEELRELLDGEDVSGVWGPPDDPEACELLPEGGAA